MRSRVTMILRYWDPGIREEESLMGRLESEIGIGDDKDQIFALISLAMTQSQLLGNAGEAREQQLQRDVREEVRELDKAQADGTEVILDPIDADQGLAAVLGMQEDQGDNSKQTKSKGTSNPKLGH
uniref:Uncharacterized protein n=1 Tax=Brassica campestris TaxID=3711 RepID=M4DXK6_BRACM